MVNFIRNLGGGKDKKLEPIVLGNVTFNNNSPSYTISGRTRIEANSTGSSNSSGGIAILDTTTGANLYQFKSGSTGFFSLTLDPTHNYAIRPNGSSCSTTFYNLIIY